ncbi:alpha-hydroxy-acid oxidizing protein [Croceicoccus ponticola]|uniref:Alpha-hydroxy-acid oxidizing protein n=1 Tax=Croceicoccus ponticola TaxID=2217664 RepID=A0A437GWD5_9SPHN|nr:alpha-hydroxy acid oxidase [Croceicoccus ponticola]RVQ65157.1 alpha-hydroxy-acid oxidizing protein [Croceicoccus ponticola]
MIGTKLVWQRKRMKHRMANLRTVANVENLRSLAQKSLPRHLFDFVDGAAFREITRNENLAQLAKIRFRQRTLRDVSNVSIGTTLLGQDCAMPLAIAPTGISGILAGGARGEILAAKAAVDAGIPYTLGMMALSSIEDVCAVAPPPFFQMCMMRDRNLVAAMARRAHDAGCPALVLTTTWPYYSQHDRLTNNPAWSMPPRILSRALIEYASRPRWAIATLFGRPIRFRNFDAHRQRPWDIVEIVGQLDASTSWDDVAWLRDLWPGKLVLKGINEPEDAERAVGLGADAVVVSNHGGNQLDECSATIEMLPAVAAAVGGRSEVLMDGGIRSGQDVLKAMALGARGCLIGRAHLYGLGAAGQAGVSKALEVIRTQLHITTGLVGLTDVNEASPAILYDPPPAH